MGKREKRDFEACAGCGLIKRKLCCSWAGLPTVEFKIPLSTIVDTSLPTALPTALPTIPTHTTALADRKRCAFAAFPDTHRRPPPNTGEEVLDAENGYIRCQDYACTQGFAVVITSHGVKKRTQVVLKCSRHGKKRWDTRKNKEKPGEKKQAILMARLQAKYDKRREIDLPVSFAVAKSEEALLYKKGQSRRRRAMTGREAADQAETVERNRRHAQSLEQSRIKKHKQIMTQEAENRPSEFSQINFPEGRQALEASVYSGVDGGIPSDDDIEFLGTQPVQVPYTHPPSPRDNCQVVGHSQKGKGRRTSFSSDSDTALVANSKILMISAQIHQVLHR